MDAQKPGGGYINVYSGGKVRWEEAMKNVMIVDGAINCAYDLFQATDDEFKNIFCEEGQDISFAEDLEKNTDALDSLSKMWLRPIHKKNVKGIDGTIFFGILEKKEFYPNLQDSDLDFKGRAFSVQKLFNN